MQEASVLILAFAIFAIIAIFLVALHSIASFFYKKSVHAEPKIVLKISPNKNAPKNPSVAEHFFSVMGGIYEPITWWGRFCGKSQIPIAFEMIKYQGIISFYVRVPQSIFEIVKGQIYAHYGEGEIEITPHDPMKNIQEKITWTTLQLTSPSLWPIKRFPQFEDASTKIIHDPLSGILLPISSITQSDEIAGMQFCIRPIDTELFRSKASNLLNTISVRKYSWGMLQTSFEQHMLRFGFWNSIFSFPKSLFFKIFKGKAYNDIEKSITPEMKTARTHDKENYIQAASDKISRMMFEVDIRLFYAAQTKSSVQRSQKVREMTASFKQFTISGLNGFTAKTLSTDTKKFLYDSKNLQIHSDMILNTEELATLFHLPNETVMLPDINWITYRKIAPPSHLPLADQETLTVLGNTNFRGRYTPFGIRVDDRRRHMYIAGKTGMGKSTLLENMIFSDIQNGYGLGVVDPHGDLADAVLHFVPKHRTNDVILFDPSDREFPISFNILECPNPEHRHLVASGVVGVFKKIFADSWGPRLEHILRNTLLALIEAGGQSLLGVLRMLGDKDYRQEIVKKIKDPVVLSFWNDEFGQWPAKQVAESISPIQNKVGQFLSSSLVRNILGQTKSSFNLRFAMDTGKIMIINLSKGKMGEDISALLGAMMITKFQLDVMSRADIKAEDRKDFYLYVDEFQNFATESFSTILSEARKYKLSLTVANQYLNQMEESVREAIFGNVGSLVSFQMGFEDSKVLSEQFGGEEVILPQDIGCLPKYNAYLRLMIDGVSSGVFSASTLAPPRFDIDESRIEIIRNVARGRYAKPRSVVEDRIQKWAWGK